MLRKKKRSAPPARRLLVLLAILFGLGTTQGIASAIGPPPLHVVRAGETLGAISRAYGVPLAQLVALNGVQDPDVIGAGERLRLPESTSGAAPAPASDEHVVRAGETVERIAATYGVSVQALVRLNALPDPDHLREGARLRVPGAGPAAAAAGAPSAVETLLEQAAARHGLDPALVQALAWHGSAWRQEAAGPGGARGVMQITPDTLDWVAERLLRRPLRAERVEDNVEGGAAYLAYLLGATGDERQAVAAYLQGLRSVRERGVLPQTEPAVEAILRLRRSGLAGQSPVSTAPSSTSSSALQQRVQETIVGTGWPAARVGVAARNLATGEQLQLRAQEVFHGASLLKLPIMVELYAQLEAGSRQRSPGLMSLLEKMIVASDNQAANQLLEVVGKDNVNRRLAGLGLTATALHNPFSNDAPIPKTGFNQTTPLDVAELLKLLAQGRVVSPRASQDMVALLDRAQDDTKLGRHLPPEVRLAHKSGWFKGVSNDVGIVFAPGGTYLLAVLAEGPFDNEAGNRLVGAVSRTVYDAWGR